MRQVLSFALGLALFVGPVNTGCSDISVADGGTSGAAGATGAGGSSTYVANVCGDGGAGPGTPPTVRVGVTEDGASETFRPLEAHAALTLQYGSQLGMGLAVSLELSSGDLGLVERIEVTLSTEGAPLGADVRTGPLRSCEDSEPDVEAFMVMIDVTQHPSVTSVAQLDGKEAELSYQVLSETAVLSEGVESIVLHL